MDSDVGCQALDLSVERPNQLCEMSQVFGLASRQLLKPREFVGFRRLAVH